MKKRLISAPITHREIPMQIGLENNTYEDMLIQNGEIEESKNTSEYKFEEPIDNNEWRFLSKI